MLTGQAETPDLDADEETIIRAAEAAFAFAACKVLPTELAAYRDRDSEVNPIIIAGYDAARRHA